jgi:hypothetical protein
MLDIVISRKPASWLLKRAASLMLAFGVFAFFLALRHGEPIGDAIASGGLMAFISGFLWVMYLIQKDGEITAQKELEAELLARQLAALVPSVSGTSVPAAYWGRAGELLRAGRDRQSGGDGQTEQKPATRPEALPHARSRSASPHR